MSAPPIGRLDVEADLRLDVDGTSAHLHGSGSRLVLFSDHPERVWAAAVASVLPAFGVADGPRAIGRVADLLQDAGVRLEVAGPHGVVVSLGDGVSSPVGRATTGSRAVRPGRPVALAVLGWQAGPRVVALAAISTTAGIALIRWALIRRARH